MKKRSTRALVLFILCFVISSSFFSVSTIASSDPTLPMADNCKAACVYDKTHGKMLVSENANTPLHTSTSAKVMTGYLACELLEGRLDETVTLSDSMLSASSGYSMKLKDGEQIKLIDLLYGAVCGSYNDACYAIASICAGSADSFVSLMNERAMELGALSTYYTNPLGYPDSDAMLTTAYDTLKIALAASENELYMKISSAKSHSISATNMSEDRTIYNRNYLISSRTTQKYFDSRCRGMNAGYSGEMGGWSVITLAEDDGAEYICIILGGCESNDGNEIYAYETANTLIDWVCETYNSYKIFEKGQIIGKAEVSMTAFGSEKLDYAAEDELYIYIPERSAPEITYRVKYITENLVAPVKQGERIGVVSVYCNGELVGECNAVLCEDAEANFVMNIINAIGEYTKSRAFIATVIFFAAVLPVAIYIKKERAIKHGHIRKY